MGTNASGDEMRKYLNAAMGRLQTGYGGAEAAYQPIYGGALGTYQDMLKRYSAGEYDPTKFNFEEDPGYKYALEQGLEQIRSRSGAEGMGQSPLTTRALMQEAVGSAQQGYGQAFNRNLAGQQARFGMGESLMSPLLPSAGAIGQARIGLGQSLAELEGQKGGISAQIAGAPFMAGQSMLRGQGGEGKQQLIAQLLQLLS
jgi:hypothetical protein